MGLLLRADSEPGILDSLPRMTDHDDPAGFTKRGRMFAVARHHHERDGEIE